MTIINFAVEQDRVLLCADTKALEWRDGSATPVVGEISKFVTLPTPNVVVANTGNHMVLPHASLIMQTASADFDGWESNWLYVAGRAFEAMLLTRRKHLGNDEVDPRQRLILAGHSKRRGCMATVMARQDDRAEGFKLEVYLPGDGWLCVWEEENQGPAPRLDSLASAQAIARAQVDYHRQKLPPPHGVGGSLIAVTLSRRSAHVQRLGYLE